MARKKSSPEDNGSSSAPSVAAQSAQNQLQSLAEKRDAVNEEALALERRRRALCKQSRGIEHRMRLAILRNFISECRELAGKVHALLPLELRDRVYEYAWEGYDASRPWRGPKRSYWTPWVLPEFVGHGVAKEAAVVYYRVKPHALPFSMPGGVETFLTVDRFHLGLNPGDHIRHLEIRILAHYNYAMLKTNMEALRQLRLMNGFRLRITLEGRVTEHLPKVLRALVPMCQELKEAGANVQVWEAQYALERKRLLDLPDLLNSMEG